VKDTSQRPWYREFWLWFVLAPPMTSIVIGLSLVGVAVTHGDSPVVDNYAQAGRALHKNDDRERAAVKLGLEGTLMLDRETGHVTVHLRGPAELPDSLDLLLSHPTHADRDVKLSMPRDSTGLYRANARRAVDGRRYMRLQSGDGQWLLAKEVAADASELSLEAGGRNAE